MLIIKSSYHLWIAAIKRGVFEGDQFPSNENYLVNDSLRFKSLEEVRDFLSQMNLILSDIKWAADLEFL
jgi:hypothetical protein